MHTGHLLTISHGIPYIGGGGEYSRWTYLPLGAVYPPPGHTHRGDEYPPLRHTHLWEVSTHPPQKGPGARDGTMNRYTRENIAFLQLRLRAVTT